MRRARRWAAVGLASVAFAYPSWSSEPSASAGSELARAPWAYDIVGNVVAETDRRGYVTTHTYDRENRRLTTHRDGVLTVETVYDAEGNAQLVKDANDHAVSYERDERGEVLRETRELASVVRYTRDRIGNVVEEIDPENCQWSRIPAQLEPPRPTGVGVLSACPQTPPAPIRC